MLFDLRKRLCRECVETKYVLLLAISETYKKLTHPTNRTVQECELNPKKHGFRKANFDKKTIEKVIEALPYFCSCNCGLCEGQSHSPPRSDSYLDFLWQTGNISLCPKLRRRWRSLTQCQKRRGKLISRKLTSKVLL